jgi:hypothetical protein
MWDVNPRVRYRMATSETTSREGRTTVSVYESTADRLHDRKTNRKESLDEVINRLLDDTEEPHE